MPLGTEVCLGPDDIVRWGPASPKGARPPNFRPMSIVAKRSPILATAELLLRILLRSRNRLKQLNEIASECDNEVTADTVEIEAADKTKTVSSVSELIPRPRYDL